MINAGKYNKKIEIVKVEKVEDGQGFKKDIETSILTTFANVKLPSGYTLILNNTDFEKATTNFTIRKPKSKSIERNMLIYYKVLNILENLKLKSWNFKRKRLASNGKV